VTLKSRELRDNYVTSYLQLKRMEDNLVRDITHLWYTLWPIAGVPQDVKTVVAILLEARKGQSKDQQGPIVVHCRYFHAAHFFKYHFIYWLYHGVISYFREFQIQFRFIAEYNRL